jgi:hypothetical protein
MIRMMMMMMMMMMMINDSCLSYGSGRDVPGDAGAADCVPDGPAGRHLRLSTRGLGHRQVQDHLANGKEST